jgi:hypothetical protein
MFTRVCHCNSLKRTTVFFLGLNTYQCWFICNQPNLSFDQIMNGSSFLLVEESIQMAHKVRGQLNWVIGKPLGKNEM